MYRDRNITITVDELLDKCIAVPDTGCFIWCGTKGIATYNAYGSIYHNKKYYPLLHRFVYYLFNGELSEDIQVLHKCDVKSCINPYHLFSGSQKENIRDCIDKKRFRCVLTEDKVMEILFLKGKLRRKEIALRYGVTVSTIKDIFSHRTWVKSEVDNKSLTKEQKDTICLLRGLFSQREIANEYGISRTVVGRIQRGQSLGGKNIE